MSFLQPWMLWGLLAASLPLWIHLFDRRKPQSKPFGAMRLLLRAQKHQASRLRLRRILLYALRTLLLLCIPLAMARPQWGSSAGQGALPVGPLATVLVVDASLSMRYRENGQSRFERAKALAKEALANLSPESPATLLWCEEGGDRPSPLGFDRQSLYSALKRPEASLRPALLNPCLEEAARLLDPAVQPNRQVILVSDFTQRALDAKAPLPLLKTASGETSPLPVKLVDAAEGKANAANVSIEEAEVEKGLPEALVRTLSVRLRNHGDQAISDLPLTLWADQKPLAKAFAQIPANSTATLTLRTQFETSGPAKVSLDVSEDGLLEDNRFRLWVDVSGQGKALLVNGAPGSTRLLDEAFFVESALGAPQSPLQAETREWKAAEASPLDAYSQVWLLNTPPPSDPKRLLRFVENGGGLVISVGSQTDAEAWNAEMSALLPRPLRELKTSADRNSSEGGNRPALLSVVDRTHPLFEPFSNQAEEGLLSARFFRYLLLDRASPGASTSDLASLDDGSVLLSLRRVGRGQVLLFASSLDRDWNDFVIRSSFLPWVQRTAAWLAGSLENAAHPSLRVGDQLHLAKAPAQPISLETESSALISSSGQEIGPLNELGHHRQKMAAGAVEKPLLLSVNVDPFEGDLSRIPPQVLNDYFQQSSEHLNPGRSNPRLAPLWSALLALGALALFFEGLVLFPRPGRKTFSQEVPS